MPKPLTISERFTIGEPLPHTHANALYIRKRIKDEFKGGLNKWYVQCTEGAAFVLFYNHGIVIDWKVHHGRHGGLWADIFKKHGQYHIEQEPTAGGTVHLTSGLGTAEVNRIGHVAYIQRVKANGDIFVKEFNWKNKGRYNERWISAADLKKKYKAQFVRYQ